MARKLAGTFILTFLNTHTNKNKPDLKHFQLQEERFPLYCPPQKMTGRIGKRTESRQKATCLCALDEKEYIKPEGARLRTQWCRRVLARAKSGRVRGRNLASTQTQVGELNFIRKWSQGLGEALHFRKCPWSFRFQTRASKKNRAVAVMGTGW